MKLSRKVDEGRECEQQLPEVSRKLYRACRLVDLPKPKQGRSGDDALPTVSSLFEPLAAESSAWCLIAVRREWCQ